MHRRFAAIFALALVLAAASSVFAAQNLPVYMPMAMSAPTPSQPTHTGEATYYVQADGGGNCSFDPTPQDLMVGAMNHVDYANSAICGAYVHIDGPNGSVDVRIVDQCPECPAGNIDLSPEAFDRIAPRIEGRVPITWRIISPDITGPIQYRFKEGSSQWWLAVQIRNHRNPIAKLEFRTADGQFVTMERQSYNYFVLFGPSQGLGIGPYTFRVTDIYGNTLTNTGIPLTVGGIVSGAGQFPKVP